MDIALVIKYDTDDPENAVVRYTRDSEYGIGQDFGLDDKDIEALLKIIDKIEKKDD